MLRNGLERNETHQNIREKAMDAGHEFFERRMREPLE
jgi:hypothetical protein